MAGVAPAESAEASVERFREEFDKLQRALKKSVNTEKLLVTKVRSINPLYGFVTASLTYAWVFCGLYLWGAPCPVP